VSHPATYHSGTPRVQHPAVARGHAHLHGLATAIHETFGLAVSPKIFLVPWAMGNLLHDSRRGVPSFVVGLRWIYEASGLKRIDKYLQEFLYIRDCNGQNHSEGKETYYDDG
jgi:hypothetical protein